MPSILDDKLLSVRLAEQPEFHVRLTEFLHSYGVIERTALVVQARPVSGSALAGVNVDDAELQKRFLAGIPTNNGWWHGFRTMRGVTRTFQGIASLPDREEPSWASEVHNDGHFVAGIWTFPVLTVQSKPLNAIADFYAEMFVHFLSLVESTLGKVDHQPTYQATWTLTNAPTLHYASKSMWGERTIAAPPVRISNLQWPISSAKVGTPEWKQLGVRMGQALTGAYGDVLRPSQ